MNPDWDGVMKSKAREPKPAGTVLVVARPPRVRLDALGALVALLREGRELALTNQRAASMRHALVNWGDRVEAALREMAREVAVPQADGWP